MGKRMIAYPKNFRTPPAGNHPEQASTLRQQRRARHSLEPQASLAQHEPASQGSASAQNAAADAGISRRNSGASQQRSAIISGLAFLSLLLGMAIPLQASVSFSADRIQKAAEQFLRKSVGPESEIEALGSVIDQHFEQEHVVARLSSAADRRSSVRNVLVEFVQNDNVLRQVMLPFRVKQYVLVPSAARTLQQGDILRRGDIVLKRTELQRAPRSIPEIDELVGRKLNTDIRPGQFLNTESAIQADGIVRGQDVILLVKRGSIEVRTRGRALADAAPGQTVRVVREGTREPILTRVRGAGIVEIIL